ncbi:MULTISPECIES: cell wall metabolism sensor histidine kinase WalK [Pseudoclavibacter]|uniref:histidine kinase n=1 Tax=Pseudoclavibacter terrae TaxID=1530195 RepID=A0A7J5B6C7_9MICO|nr:MULTISPECIES: ATP-binding protein [Pseudoclavibacter]KAB1639677.1 HAMP domain-containing protein [Pseudoclavibacter terrae]PPG39519.1 two-component sensor histidine kinase [Pseudoclavibacter sp. RFBA6]
MRPWTLRARIIVGVTLVVAFVMSVIGIMNVVTLNSAITSVVNTQLAASMSVLENSVDKYRDDIPGTHPHPPKNGETSAPKVKPLINFVGHAPGTIIALAHNGEIIDSASFSETSAVECDQTIKNELAALAQSDGFAAQHSLLETIKLDDVAGDFRVMIHEWEGDPSYALISAVSLDTAREATLNQTVLTLVLSSLGIGLIVLLVALVMRVAMRPLSRVVNAAENVAQMPLASGEVGLRQAVKLNDIDPRTEVGKVSEALDKLLAHVDEAFAVRSAADQRMRRFVTDASHELRTPLAAIQGYAELTRQDSASLPDTTERSLARIESEATRMSSLVNDLLLLARLDEGQDLQFDTVDLSELVINAVSDAQASDADRHWSATVPPSEVSVLGDWERLHQIVVNLLSNASQHTPQGTHVNVSVRYELATASATGREAVLVVRDDGPGIPATLRQDLFSRFARGDSARTRASGSTGLGLAIVKSIVEAHGGHIAVESDDGAAFIVRIPAAKAWD